MFNSAEGLFYARFFRLWPIAVVKGKTREF